MDGFLETKIKKIINDVCKEYKLTTGVGDFRRLKAGDLFLPGKRWSYCSGPPLNEEQERIFLAEFTNKMKRPDDTWRRDNYKEFMKGVLEMVDDDTMKKKLFFLKGDTQNPLLAKIHSELVEEAEKWSAERLSGENLEIELPTTVVRRPVEMPTEESSSRSQVRSITRARTNQAETLRERVQRRLRIFWERFRNDVILPFKVT